MPLELVVILLSGGYVCVWYLVGTFYTVLTGDVYFSYDKSLARGVIFGAVWPVYLVWLLLIGIWKMFALAFGKED